METNTLFKLGAYVYKVMPNPEDRCTHCAGYLQENLCFKLPDCGVAQNGSRTYFKRLNKRELKQAEKQKINIIQLTKTKN